jgi:hypothetical protein
MLRAPYILRAQFSEGGITKGLTPSIWVTRRHRNSQPHIDPHASIWQVFLIWRSFFVSPSNAM